MTTRQLSTGAMAADPETGGADLARGDKYPKVAPFTSMRWAGDLPEVELDAQLYRLRAIDGIGVDRLIEFAKKAYDRIWQKRISEDLVQVMAEFGQPPGGAVTLRLEDIVSRAEVVRKDVPMTRENRQKVWRANKAGVR